MSGIVIENKPLLESDRLRVPNGTIHYITPPVTEWPKGIVFKQIDYAKELRIMERNSKLRKLAASAGIGILVAMKMYLESN